MIDLTPGPAPRCTVVVPVYGGVGFVLDTLEALAAHSRGEVQVVVVDNASPDGAGEAVASGTRGVVLVRNPANLGFGVACNQGAARATTPLVCFLNSDARVSAGWLDHLAAALDADAEAAAAVPRYLEPDGTLQEAGAVLQADGVGVLIGAGAAADDPAYRFPRVVEYGSAACLLVRRADLASVGGFDPEFGLAYGEDADLALRLAERGRRVRYVPAATVVHERGASGGAALAELRARNADLAARRFAHRLRGRPTLDDLGHHPERLVALRDVGCPERVLVAVDHVPPDGGPLDALLGELAGRWPEHRVTAMTIHRPGAEHERWLALGIEVADGHDDWYGWARSRIGHATVTWTIGAGPAARFGALLRAAQPQATRVHTPGPGLVPPRSAPWPRPVHARMLGESPVDPAAVDAAVAAAADLVVPASRIDRAPADLAAALGFGREARSRPR